MPIIYEVRFEYIIKMTRSKEEAIIYATKSFFGKAIIIVEIYQLSTVLFNQLDNFFNKHASVVSSMVFHYILVAEHVSLR